MESMLIAIIKHANGIEKGGRTTTPQRQLYMLISGNEIYAEGDEMVLMVARLLLVIVT